jgi:hypothetical protein
VAKSTNNITPGTKQRDFRIGTLTASQPPRYGDPMPAINKPAKPTFVPTPPKPRGQRGR